MIKKNYEYKEIKFNVGSRKLTASMLSPQKENMVDSHVIVLSFSMAGQQTLNEFPSNIVSNLFLENGHRAISFDLPNHGKRVNQYGSDISGLMTAFINGEDPFEMFVEDVSALIDKLFSMGLAVPGKIAICGISRAGYMALRAFANDNRIFAATSLAPVTDWRYLSEFKLEKKNKNVEKIKIENYIGSLTGRPIYLAIGNNDDRVSTKSCKEFYNKLVSRNKIAEYNVSDFVFHITEDKGHTLDTEWRTRGAEFLLAQLKNKSAQII